LYALISIIEHYERNVSRRFLKEFGEALKMLTKSEAEFLLISLPPRTKKVIPTGIFQDKSAYMRKLGKKQERR